MRRDYKMRKRIILAALGVLLAADGGLAYLSWKTATAKLTPQQVLARSSAQVKLLKADVERARTIRKDTPVTLRDCDRFERSMPSAESGYSTVTSEIGRFAHQAGVNVVSLAYSRSEPQGRPFIQVSLTTSIEGDYRGVVQFVNALQRSEGFYIVDDLSLDGSKEKAGGRIRVMLHIRTFFRSAA